MLSHYKILVSCAEYTVWVRVSVKNAAVTVYVLELHVPLAQFMKCCLL